jgi:GntR family transcriptional regulator
VWEVERIRSTADGPLAWMRNWMAGGKALTEAALAADGLYSQLRQQGVEFDRAVPAQRVGAETARKAVADRLGVKPGAALLTFHRIARDTAGALVEIGDHKYRADRHRVELTARGDHLG